MKIKLKNIGMLDEAEFQVGDLTIICGENNTGKTYATYSLYGYLDFIREINFSLLLRDNEYFELLNDVNIDDCKFEIPIQTFENILIKFSNFIFSVYKNKFVEVLAGKDGDFNKSDFKDDSIEQIIGFLKKDDKKTVENYFSHSPKFDFHYINKKTIVFNFEKNRNIFVKNTSNDFSKYASIETIVLYIYSRQCPNPFIISAERTGASMFQKELDVNKSEIVEEISRADTKNINDIVLRLLIQRYSRYPKPVKDNIYFIRDLDKISKITSFVYKNKEDVLNQTILNLLYEIVGGKYIVSQEGIEFAPGAKKRITRGKVAIQRASSSVRSLLMLNYYILHAARKNDILMIDEPELNLHPSNQILMARLLVLLVNAGVKVFITTHSDYILREISNCIMLNSLDEKQIDKIKNKGYAKEYKLSPKKVKAYLAENKKGKNILSNVNVNNHGIFMNTFDYPIDTQNENQGLIFDELLKSDKNDKL